MIYFIAICLGFLNNLYSQNLFMVYISTYSSDFRDSVKDVVDVKLDFKKENDSKFNFENLILSPSPLENVSEEQISNIEEEDIEELGEFPNVFLLAEPQPINLGGDGKIKIKRKDTGESDVFVYRNSDGSYNLDELERMKHIMRSSLEGEKRKVPIRLVEILDAIQDKFGKNKEIILLSGYRTKSLNEITPGAAKYSLHMLGWACDIRINGVSARKIRDFARKLNIGGVGYYPRYNYVHIDIGKPRYWEKYQYSKKKRYAKKRNKVANFRTAGFSKVSKKGNVVVSKRVNK